MVIGKYIDIPTKKFLLGLNSKKERILFFHTFLEKCVDLFGLTAKIKNVYLPNGQPILDLKEISEEEKYIYISLNDIFVGINIMNYRKQVKDIKLSNHKEGEMINQNKEIKKNNKTDDNSNKNDKKIKFLQKDKEKNYSSMKFKNKFYYYKNLNYIINSNLENFEKDHNHSFDIGFYKRKVHKNEIKENLFHKIKYKNYDDKYKDDHYFSDTEKKKINAWNFIQKNFSDIYKLNLYFYDFLSSHNWFLLRKKIKEKYINKLQNKKKKKKLKKKIIK